MESICKVCKNSAEVCCSCDHSLKFCYKDYFKVHKRTRGTHEPIDLEVMNLSKKFMLRIENLKNMKSQVISKSTQLINLIQYIATKKLSFIDQTIDACENF